MMIIITNHYLSIHYFFAQNYIIMYVNRQVDFPYMLSSSIPKDAFSAKSTRIKQHDCMQKPRNIRPGVVLTIVQL